MKLSIGKLLPLLGVAGGIVLGLYIPLQIPKEYTVMVAIVLLAAFDSILGALKAYVARDFKLSVFMGGLVFNMIVAAFLTYLGNILNLSIYLGVIFVFVTRMFKNLSRLRKMLLNFDRNSDKL